MSANPRTLTQWLVLIIKYPAIITIIASAFPTFQKAYHAYGTPISITDAVSKDMKEMSEQNQCFQDNAECLQKTPFAWTINRSNIEVGSLVCESGDAFLTARQGEKSVLRCIPLTKLTSLNNNSAISKTGNLFNFTAVASAMEPNNIIVAQAQTVLCQKWVGNGQLLQRIQTSTGCFDQVINTYTGTVITKNPAPCNPNC